MKFKKSFRRSSPVVSEFPKPDYTKFERLENEPIEGYEERLERYRNGKFGPRRRILKMNENELRNRRSKFWRDLQDESFAGEDAIDICSLNDWYSKRARKLYKVGVLCTKEERNNVFRRIAKIFNDHVSSGE